MSYQSHYPDEYDIDYPCLICGNEIDDCICKECPECGSQGDPECYESHGLYRSLGQIISLAKNERQWEEDAIAISDYEQAMPDWNEELG